MTSRLIVLRPEPGASTTARRAKRADWAVIVLPLFEIAPLAWTPPDPGNFDAVLMTSANCARFGGDALARYHALPLYTVGSQTAEAAREAGFETIASGTAGVADMADRLRADGMTHIFHPAGEMVRLFDESELSVTHLPIYTARRVTPPDIWADLGNAIEDNIILLVHSPRSARYLDELCHMQGIVRSTLSLVAISSAALAEAGRGWRVALAAEHPTDDAMLAAASSLISEP